MAARPAEPPRRFPSGGLLTGLAAALCALTACPGAPPERAQPSGLPADSVAALSDSIRIEKRDTFIVAPPDDETTPLDSVFLAAGLVDILDYAPDVRVDLRYASENNFMGKAVYGDLRRCYLRPEAAEKLARAQAALEELRPGCRLTVFDGARPQSAQFKMWEIVKGTPQARYVASPWAGSLHNFGCSVDLSIADENGELLDMGTAFDDLSPLSQPRYEKKFLASGELTEGQIANRKLLRKVMLRGGFRYLLLEWWHFNAFRNTYIRENFPLIK